MVTLAILAALALALAAAGWLAAAFLLAERLTRSRGSRVEGAPADVLLRHEEVEFPAADGRAGRGWYCESPGARATVVLVHDIAGTRSDPRQGLLRLQRDYVRRGLNVLSFDLRGRGELSVGRDRPGAGELSDVLGAVACARARGEGLPVVLHGFGLGAALALVAAARNLPVACVIADSPFSSMRAYLRYGLDGARGPLFGPAAWFMRRCFGADVDAIAPERAIPHLGGVPVLYIHAEGDRETPVEHTLNLSAASLNPADRVWVAPVVEHCGAYRADPGAYLARCLDFVESATPARPLAARAG